MTGVSLWHTFCFETIQKKMLIYSSMESEFSKNKNKQVA